MLPQSNPNRDRDMTEYLYDALKRLPGEIGGIEVEAAAMTNQMRIAKGNLEDAELNATLSAPQDGKKRRCAQTRIASGNRKRYERQSVQTGGDALRGGIRNERSGSKNEAAGISSGNGAGRIARRPDQFNVSVPTTPTTKQRTVTMNTQLAKRNGNTAVAIPDDYIPVAGIEKLSPDDFSIPVVKLVQTNTSIEDADTLAGQWYRTDTGETSETIRALIIGIAKSRILFPTEYNGEGKALCRSDDSVAPRAEHIGQPIYYQAGNEKRRTQISEAEGGPYDMTLPPTCAECPLSQWGLNGEKPPCRLSDNWAALTNDGDPVLIRFGGSAAKISAKLRNLARAATAKKRPLYVELSSHFEKGEIGQYYVPDLMLLKEALPADLLDTARAFVGLNLAARAAEMLPDDEEQHQDTQPKFEADPN